jgi:toxin ParE1/3/4
VTPRPVILREAARRDIDDAIAHYASEARTPVALAFIDAIERAFRQVARHPASGSPRYASELRIDGLRAWPLRRFPFLVFYRDAGDRLDAWRVLYAQRDIPAWMHEAGAP